VRTRVDIEGIQKWLTALDPNDGQDQPLEVKIAPGAKISNPPKYIPIPPSVGRLGRYSNRLLRDDAGRPMIRFQLGGDCQLPMIGTGEDGCSKSHRLRRGFFFWRPGGARA
jgi:hypothetical protein